MWFWSCDANKNTRNKNKTLPRGIQTIVKSSSLHIHNFIRIIITFKTSTHSLQRGDLLDSILYIYHQRGKRNWFRTRFVIGQRTVHPSSVLQPCESLATSVCRMSHVNRDRYDVPQGDSVIPQLLARSSASCYSLTHTHHVMVGTPWHTSAHWDPPFW